MMLNRRTFSIAAFAAWAAAGGAHSQSGPTLATARKGFKTVVHYDSAAPRSLDKPPKKLFNLVSYPSAVGDLAAYLTPDPKDGQKHSAIVWMTGGETNRIGDVWSSAPMSNDQSAAAYRKAGIAMMFPSLRGGNANPGQEEALFGEVDDVLAAADYLAAQPWVDPARIYLGGHSVGGTVVMLAAEMAGPRFRAAFAFGAVEDVALYGPYFGIYDFQTLPKDERVLRAPGAWLSSVEVPLFVIEGDHGNVEDLRIMKAKNLNARIAFVEVPNATHFSVLGPANAVIAAKIAADSGQGPIFSLTAEEITARMKAG